MSSLSELIERVENAVGPDRRIDPAICRIIDLPKCEYPDRLPDVMVRIINRVEAGGDDPEVPAYTGSLDAALTLLPEGRFLTLDRYSISDKEVDPFAWRVWIKWFVGDMDGDGPLYLQEVFATGPTLALALVAACLKARLLDAASSEARG